MPVSEESGRLLLAHGRWWAAGWREFWWNLTGRPGWLAGLALNVALVTGYVVYHRTVASFPERGLPYIGTAFAAWILADTVTTNQLGSEGERVVAAMSDDVPISRILAVKNLGVLLVLLTITVPVTVVATAWVQQWRQLPDALLVDLHVVLVWLGLGNIVSVLLPYQPLPLRQRRHLRRTWLRWGICLLAPYGLYGMMGWLSVPVRLMADVTRRQQPTQYALLSLALGIAYWAAGLLVATYLARLDHTRFRRNLVRTS